MPSSNAVVGALRVILGADTAAFDKGLTDANKRLNTFGSAVKKTLAGLGIGAAITGVGLAFKNAVDEADKLTKLSQSIGVPVEQLSALKHAADLSGVSIEDVGKSVGRLARSMSELAGGKNTGGASDAFRALGISATDASGRLKSTNQVLEEVADRFAGMQDGAGKTALAISLFGRSGAALIPLLNQGAAGLKEAREEAEALGLVINTRTGRAAEQFNDNLTRLQRVVSGVALKVAAELAPSLVLVTNQIVEYVKSNNAAVVIAEKVIGGLDLIGRAAAAVAHIFSALARESSTLFGVLSATTFSEMSAAWARFREEGQKTDASFRSIGPTFQNFQEQAKMLADNLGNTASQAGKVAAPVLATKTALDEFFKSQAKAIASQQADAQAVGLAAGARERLRLVMQAESIARENNIKLTDAQRIQITQLANAIQQATLQQQGFNLVLEAAEPHEKFRLEMERNAQALAAVGATATQVAQVNRMTAEKFGATWEQVTAGAAGGFAQLATEMGKSNAKIATVAKALAIVEATINSYVAFTKALASTPPPLNYIAAAGVLAAGLAKVAAIKSQSIPKMASGGTLIPNQFSGQDSVLMQARVRPDERVRVERPGEGSDRRGGAIEIMLRISDAAQRSFWADGIEQINRLTGDGYRLKVAT